MTSYMKDENMEAARLKIIAVLKEHDLMGAVCFAGKQRAGFFHEVSPTWSCARIEETPEGVGIRVKSKREDYESLEQQGEHVTSTVNGLLGMLHVNQHIGQMLTSLVTMIGTKMDIRSITHDERVQKIDPNNIQ